MKNLIIVLTIFFMASVSFAQLDRSKIPQAAPAPTFAFPKYDLVTTANGIKVILVKDTKLPQINISLFVDNKPILEKEFAGGVNLTGQLLKCGTKTRTKDQIDKEIDFLGASLSTSGTSAYASGLSKYTEKILDLLSDVILNPVFPEDEIEKLKERTISGLKYRKSDPNQLQSVLQNLVVYGKDHPFGEFETEESINKVDRNKCLEFYKTYFKPNFTYLTVVGNFDKNDIIKTINKYFGKWEKGTVPSPKYKDVINPSRPQVDLLDRSNSVQSVIGVAHVVDLKKASPDAIPARIMNTILGGGIFRLFLNLREKHSFTYGAYSSLNSDELVGSFSANTSVRNSVTDSALTEILYEMNRIRNEKVEKKELDMAKNYISGSFTLSLENPSTIASFASNIERYKLPKDYYKTYLKKIEAVSIDKVQEMAKKYIKPENVRIALVGSASEVKTKLEKFGAVTIYDEDFNKVEDKGEAKIDLTAEQVIDKYIEKTGGKEKYLTLKDKTQELSGKMQNFELTVTLITKAPNKLYTEIAVGNMFKQQTAFDGVKGWTSGMQGMQDLDDEKVAVVKDMAIFNFWMDYKTYGIKAELKGLKTVKQKDMYEVHFTKEGKTLIKHFYGKEDFLLYREIKSQKGPNGAEVEQATDYSDYKEMSGFMVPAKWEQSAMGQNIELKLEKFEVNKGVDDKVFAKP